MEWKKYSEEIELENGKYYLIWKDNNEPGVGTYEDGEFSLDRIDRLKQIKVIYYIEIEPPHA